MRENSSLKKRNALSNKRAKTVFLIFLGSFSLILFRALWLQTVSLTGKKQAYLKRRSYHKKSKDISYRGTIFDHKKRPLAISIKAVSLSVNPHVFRPTKKETRKIAKILGVSQKKIKKLEKKKSFFAWLKRKASQEEARLIKQLKIKGINLIQIIIEI